MYYDTKQIASPSCYRLDFVRDFSNGVAPQSSRAAPTTSVELQSRDVHLSCIWSLLPAGCLGVIAETMLCSANSVAGCDRRDPAEGMGNIGWGGGGGGVSVTVIILVDANGILRAVAVRGG